MVDPVDDAERSGCRSRRSWRLSPDSSDSCAASSSPWAGGRNGRRAGLLLFLVPVTVLMENPLRADADFGTVIDFLKNLAIMGGLLMVVMTEYRNANQ